MRCARGQVRDAPSRSGDATLHPAAHAPPPCADGHQVQPARTGTGHSRHHQRNSQRYPLHSDVSSRSFTSGVHVRQMRTMYWPPAARARRSCRLPLRLRAANIGRWQAAPACWQHANAQRLCRTPNGREVCFRPPLRRSRQVVTKKSKGCLSREGAYCRAVMAARNAPATWIADDSAVCRIRSLGQPRRSGRELTAAPAR